MDALSISGIATYSALLGCAPVRGSSRIRKVRLDEALRRSGLGRPRFEAALLELQAQAPPAVVLHRDDMLRATGATTICGNELAEVVP